MTPRERDCLDAIIRLTVDGVAPTFRALMTELNLTSSSGIYRLIEGLERQGYIEREPFRSRSIQVVTPEAFIKLGLSIYGAEALRAELERSIVNTAIGGVGK